jgi:hypothetical protein
VPGVWPGSGIRTSRLGGGCACRLDFPGVYHDGCILEELIAAAMIRMKVRIHDNVDVIGVDTDACEIRQ